MRQLSAFVACAFGRDDVEALYDRAIKRALREGGVTPLRVDRLEHNDDIDDKILELIEACDFCIADLTYARPSVYYEAGRVHGSGKPVIFTARSDHFRTGTDDDFGNLRIHFDLQMKNIIKWSKPTNTFRARLASRIRVITRPIQKAHAIQQTEVQARELFAKLPLLAKRSGVLDAAQRMLAQMGWTIDRTRGRVYLKGLLRRNRQLIFVVVLASTSFTRRQLENLPNPPDLVWLHEQGLRSMDELVSHVVCCAIRAVPLNRVEDALPSFYRRDGVNVYSRADGRGSSPDVHIHILDSIQSWPDLRLRLSSHFDWILSLANQGISSEMRKNARAGNA